MVSLVRNILFNVLWAVWTILLAILGILPMLVAKRCVANIVARIWLWGSLSLLKYVVGLRFQLEGREHMSKGPAIYVAKHQSAFETLVLYQQLPKVQFVLKKELKKIPFFGPYVVAANIVVDREGSVNALKGMVRACNEALSEGRSVLIFPEGTRTSVGETGRYKTGVSALYMESDVPVIPIALNTGLYWSKGAFLKKPGVASIKLLPASPKGLKRGEFMQQLQQAIESETRALEAAHD